MFQGPGLLTGLGSIWMAFPRLPPEPWRLGLASLEARPFGRISPVFPVFGLIHQESRTLARRMFRLGKEFAEEDLELPEETETARLMLGVRRAPA
jgi:hypothetical protein